MMMMYSPFADDALQVRIQEFVNSEEDAGDDILRGDSEFAGAVLEDLEAE